MIDPATETKVASVASATVEDAIAALDAAQAAFPGWAPKKPRERGEILRKSYDLIMRDAERLAKLITIENGKALSDSRGEVAYAAEFFRWYAEELAQYQLEHHGPVDGRGNPYNTNRQASPSWSPRGISRRHDDPQDRSGARSPAVRSCSSRRPIRRSRCWR